MLPYHYERLLRKLCVLQCAASVKVVRQTGLAWLLVKVTGAPRVAH